MKEDKVIIAIPKADERDVVDIPPGSILGEIKKKFEKIDQILFGIMLAVVLSLVAIIVSVVGMFLDQMRFNNAAYEEYSEKLRISELLKENILVLQDQNERNQELIIKQQKQILDNIQPERK